MIYLLDALWFGIATGLIGRVRGSSFFDELSPPLLRFSPPLQYLVRELFFLLKNLLGETLGLLRNRLIHPRFAAPVDDDIAAGSRKPLGDGVTDASGRSRDQRRLS